MQTEEIQIKSPDKIDDDIEYTMNASFNEILKNDPSV